VPEGGLSLWIRLDDRTTAAELERRAVAQGLAVTPGPLFASDRTTLSRHLRLPFTATQETLTRAVDILRRLEPR
jgi:DNA-binding transcriptional MocR family regulator